MATRANIKIVLAHGGEVWLYRHWDGYPAVNGAVLAHAASKAASVHHFAGLLLTEMRDGTSYDPVPRNDYELTDAMHGDIEWLYTFRHDFHKGWLIDVTEVPLSMRSWETDAEPGTRPILTSASLTDFVAYVNREIADTNRRVAQLNVGRNPETQYAPLTLIAV